MGPALHASLAGMRRIRTIHQEYAAGGGWRLEEADPHPALAGLVLRYAGYEERGGQPIERREWAVPYIPVIVNFGAAFAITDRTTENHASFAAGLFDRPVTVASAGAAHCLQFDLTPAGAQLFFGQPLGAIANRIVSLEDLLGADGRRPSRRTRIRALLERSLRAARNWR